jgi:geranylgeranylglycerol-phosphate geranylgeranyltransferase
MFIGAGNTLNDYLDRDIDKKNHPNRPIPKGTVSPKAALTYSIILFIISIIGGLWLSIECMLIILLNLGLMLAYEFKLKNVGLSGNLTISWLTASIFLFGGYAIIDIYPNIMEPVFFMFILSFLATLGREIAKDIEDIEGDEGRTTLPMKIGIDKARHVSIMTFLFAIGLSPLPYYYDIFGFWYLIAVSFANAIFIYAAYVLAQNPHKTSEGAKLAMLLSLVAFLAGVI